MNHWWKKMSARRAWPGVLFMVLFLLLFAYPVKGRDRSSLGELPVLQEEMEGNREEESRETSVLMEEMDPNILPSVQIQIKEEYVEVIPAVKEVPVHKDKREDKNLVSESAEVIPSWMGAITMIGNIFLSAGAFLLYLSLCTCRVYWLDHNRKRFLGFVRCRKKEDGYLLNIPESMLENSQGVEYMAVFPVIFRYAHRYEALTIMLGGEKIESYVEKSIRIQSGLSIFS